MTTAQGVHSLHKENKDTKTQNSFNKTFDKNSRTSGIGSEVHATGANNSYTDNNDDDDDDNDEILYDYDFKMTDDQQKAAGELQNLKLDLGFTEDEPGPFYDVSERLRRLNEELAQEQIPRVEERNRKIQFKDNLVDFVAPPPDHDMEYEPHSNRSDSDSGNSLDHKSDIKKNGLKVEDKDVEKGSVGSGASSDRKETADDELGDAPPKKGVISQHEGEGVVLERNGRFEFVAVKDLTPEEREIYDMGPSSVLQSNDGPRSAPESSRSSTVKKPERKSSVASSVSRSDSTGSRPSNSSRGPTVTSARGDSRSNSQKEPMWSARLNSQSDSQKKQPSSSMSDMKKYEQKRKEDEAKRRKQEESDHIYQAWLKKKDEEKKKEKQNKKEHKDDKEKEKDKSNDEAYEDWKARKQRQMQREKKLKEEEAKYYMSQYQTPTDTECEKNFKTWLKNKERIAREKEEEERQKMKTFRVMARRSRNSANAGGQGSSAYIDYYGYRV